MSHSKPRPKHQYISAVAMIIVLMGVLLAVNCQRHTKPPAPSDRTTTSAREHATANLGVIRVATSKNLWCTLTLVADEQGFFAAEGLSPTLNYQAAGRLNMDALLGGAADIANVVETNIAYQALNRTKNLTVVGRVVGATDYAIVTKRSANIRRPSDLRGKRLAYAQATGAESFLFWFLDRESIPIDSLTLVPLQPAGLVDHFLGERTEAVVSWEPFVSTIRKRLSDPGTVFQSDPSGFAGMMTIATRADWLAKHQAIMAAYERAMARSSRFVADNPAKAQDIVSRRTGIPVDTVRAIWTRFDFTYRRPVKGDVQLIHDVIRRIKNFVPAMSNTEALPAELYFAEVR